MRVLVHFATHHSRNLHLHRPQKTTKYTKLQKKINKKNIVLSNIYRKKLLNVNQP